jgi:hypothetical protein
MTRRAWLSLLAGAVLDPERLLWVPGRRVISIPAPAVMDHSWDDWSWDEINEVTLQYLRESLVMEDFFKPSVLRVDGRFYA